MFIRDRTSARIGHGHWLTGQTDQGNSVADVVRRRLLTTASRRRQRSFLVECLQCPIALGDGVRGTVIHRGRFVSFVQGQTLSVIGGHELDVSVELHEQMVLQHPEYHLGECSLSCGMLERCGEMSDRGGQRKVADHLEQ